MKIQLADSDKGEIILAHRERGDRQTGEEWERKGNRDWDVTK